VKKSKFLGIVLSMALMTGLLPGLTLPQPVAAASTETITVTKYDTDGATILNQVNLTYAEMEAYLPVQGDGETLYYMQGPTFQPDNLWDPDETVNLKNKGAIKGTDVKDLCELVGGAEAGDQIQIKADDGYNQRFYYDNIYNPTPQQGKFVLAWYTKNAGDTYPLLYPDGAYVPEFASGMQLVFLVENTNDAGQYVFGHQDMRDSLPEDNWHFYYDGTVEYPSANGLSIKNISEVNIYSQPAPAWSIDVTGAVTQPVSQSWFENALACHETAYWTDGSGNVWSGLPLWWLVGLADDQNIHGPFAFNDPLAAAGYDIEVRAVDNYAKVFASQDVARSSDYIIANQKNGAPLSEADGYPLKLVGNAVAHSGSLRVGKIASINLLNIPTIETWTLALSGAINYDMMQVEFEGAVNCNTIDHKATYTDTNGDTWTGLPLWLLVGWVDDDIMHGPGSFNDALATAGYQVRVTATDGYYYTFDSVDVARNDGIIVVNKVNGQDLAEGSYPLRLNGDGFAGGSGWKVREIVRIELLNLPVVADWELELSGMTSSTLAAADFANEAAANPASWVDGSGNNWSGVALWRLVGKVDDGDPATFNDDFASRNYSITVIASDGFSRSFDSTLIARNDSIIIANQLNGQPLPENRYPLRLVGTGLSSGQMVSKVVRIEFTVPWDLELVGFSSYTMPNTEFATEAAANPESYVDGSDFWSGLALWRLVARVDDGDPTTLNSMLAELGYQIKIIAADGYSKTFDSSSVAFNDDIIVANLLNGDPLPPNRWPLRINGPGLSGGQKVSQIAKIELLNLPLLMDEYSVQNMTINFTHRLPMRDDVIIGTGTFALPDGTSFNPATDEVIFNIDGVEVVVPAGSFRKLGNQNVYTYRSRGNERPMVSITLDFRRGTWDFKARNIDASAINGFDGVSVTMVIGGVIGTENINMLIDSLSYRP